MCDLVALKSRARGSEEAGYPERGRDHDKAEAQANFHHPEERFQRDAARRSVLSV